MKFWRLLNSNAAPYQIGLGVAFGLFLELVPISTLQWWVFLFLMFVLQANTAAGFLFKKGKHKKTEKARKVQKKGFEIEFKTTQEFISSSVQRARQIKSSTQELVI